MNPMERSDPEVGAGAPSGDAAPEGFRSGFVALAGRANVGKSTLMNRLLGTKLSIVSDVPQTTRVLKEVDLVAVLVDASDGLGPGDRFVFDLVTQAGSRNLLILNKIDLMPRERLLPLIDDAATTGLFEEIVPLSALNGENCDRLERVIVARMPPGPPHFPPETLTDLPERLAVAEIIREQVFQKTRQEVPHATAVMIESVRKDPGGLARVDATIVVDRPSQKGILIGEGGSMMKTIGTAARHNLEAFLGSRVHLSLWVKVKEGWRDDAALLRLIGLLP